MTTDAPYTLLRELEPFRGAALPPIHAWQPAHCRDIDIRIDREGRWYHEGTRIQRQRLVRLFSTILRREGDAYFLVTPVEKCRIQVEDVPFVAVLLEVSGAARDQRLDFTTSTGDVFPLDAAHPLRMVVNPATGEPSPYVRVRDGLEARLNRSVYYQLAELLVEEMTGAVPTGAVPTGAVPSLGVWSCGTFFPLTDLPKED